MSAIFVVVVELFLCSHNNNCFVVDRREGIDTEKMKATTVQRRTIIKATRGLLIEIQHCFSVIFILLLCIS